MSTEFEQKPKKTYDFSQSAVKKSVLRSSIQHPSVVYPAAIGVLGGIAVTVLGLTPILMGALIAGGLVAALAWINQYWLRNDYLSSVYVNRLLKAIGAQQQEKIDRLKSSLENMDADEAYQQFQRLEDKYQAFRQLINNKFESGELTHARFIGMIEQVFLGAIDNLQKITHLLKSSQAIDHNFIRQRIDELKQQDNDLGKREQSTLQSRLDIYNDQQNKIQSLLIDNEEAMTQIDVTMHAVTDSEGIDSNATIDLESAMSELQHLANRARKY